MLRILCILLFCFTAVCCQTKKEKAEWKKYENFMYSIELPSDIEYRSKYDFLNPEFQDRGNRRVCYASWSNVPFMIENEEQRKELSNAIAVHIRTEENKDGNIRLDVEQEVKAMVKRAEKVEVCKEIYSSADEKRYLLIYTSREGTGFSELNDYVHYLIYKKDGNMQHNFSLSFRKTLLEKRPGFQETVDRILSSFILK